MQQVMLVLPLGLHLSEDTNMGAKQL